MNVPFIIQVFKARFKAAATPSFWAAFFLLSAGILALGLLFNRENGLRIRVGVLRPETELTENLLERFKYYAGENSEIVIYKDEEQMKLDVSAHKLECAYVFGEEKAVAYRSPQTAADMVFDLTVAAAYTEKTAGELGAETLAAYPLKENSLAEEIQRRADEYLKDGALMQMEYVELNASGGLGSAEQSPYYRLFRGLTGLAVLLPALLCAMGMAGADKSAEARLKAAGVFTIAAFLVIFALSALFMLATLTAGNVLFPVLILDWPAELLTAFSLTWAAAGLAVLLTAVIPADAFPAAVSFIFIFAAVFGGAVFEMREVIESAAPAGYLFPNYYYVIGNWPALLIIGAGCCGTALILKTRVNK